MLRKTNFELGSVHTHSESAGTGLHVIAYQRPLVLKIQASIFMNSQGHGWNHHAFVKTSVFIG
jgi:hypothetical protein